MGGFVSKQQERTVICCGLENSGKSTIVNALKPARRRVTTLGPTVGYQVEEVEMDKTTFKVFDMGGGRKFRNLWERFFPDAQGVIFVVDSSDRVRMALVKEELEQILAHPALTTAPILVYANKKDVAGGQTFSEISDTLRLGELCATRPYRILASNALTGEGLTEGMTWLGAELSKR